MERAVELNDLTQKRMLEALRAGNTRAASATLAGISRATLRAWARRAKDGEAPLAAFFDRIAQAEGEAERDAVGVVRDAAREHWQAAAWWLERRRQRTWGKKEKPTPKLPDDVSKLSDDQLAAELEKIVVYASNHDPGLAARIASRLAPLEKRTVEQLEARRLEIVRVLGGMG